MKATWKLASLEEKQMCQSIAEAKVNEWCEAMQVAIEKLLADEKANLIRVHNVLGQNVFDRNVFATK